MNKNKGFIGLGLILAIIAVLAVGGGAYYLTKSKSGDKKEIEYKNTENQVKEIEKDYLTHTDTKYGYKFNYRKDRFLNSNLYERKGVNIESCNYLDDSCVTSSPLYSVFIEENIKNITDLKSFIKENSLSGMSSSCGLEPVWSENNKIDGNPTIQVSRSVCAGGGEGEKYPIPMLGTIHNNVAYFINFSKGEYIGEEKVEFDNLVLSFKFLNSEDFSTEIFNNQPGEIKSITKTPSINEWILAVDLLTKNSNFMPGKNEFFINQNTKIRNFNMTENTKIYGCGDDTKDISIFLNIQKSLYKIARFDINGTNITAIYQQCLP